MLLLRRVLAVLVVAFAIAFLPVSAWADDGPTGYATSDPRMPVARPESWVMGTPPAEGETTWVDGPAELDAAQMVVYSTPPTPVELDPGQFAALMVGIAVLVSFAGADLVLGMRR